MNFHVLDIIRDIHTADPAEADAPIGFIGELSERLGISAQAVRFYEREGLVSPRRIGRYRTFSRMDGLHLTLTVALRSLGFAVGEIKQIRAALLSQEPEVFLGWFRERARGHLEALQQDRQRITREIAATEQLTRQL